MDRRTTTSDSFIAAFAKADEKHVSADANDAGAAADL
jgi:hypothetical protein